MIATSQVHLGIVALDWGDHWRAERYLAESVKLLQELGDRWQTTLALEVCAGLLAARAYQPPHAEHAGRRATELFGAVETLREMLGAPLLHLYHDHRQRSVAARTHLDQVRVACYTVAHTAHSNSRTSRRVRRRSHSEIGSVRLDQ